MKKSSVYIRVSTEDQAKEGYSLSKLQIADYKFQIAG